MRWILKLSGALLMSLVVNLVGFCADSGGLTTFNKVESLTVGGLKFEVYLHAHKDLWGKLSYTPSYASFSGFSSEAVKEGTLIIPESVEYNGTKVRVDYILGNPFSDPALSTIVMEGRTTLSDNFMGFKGNLILKKGAEKITSDDAFAGLEGTLTNHAVSVSEGFFDAVSRMNTEKATVQCRYSIYDRCKEAFSGKVEPLGIPVWIENAERLIDCYKFTVGYYGNASEQNLKVIFKNSTVSSENGQYKIRHISPIQDYELIFDYDGDVYMESIPTGANCVLEGWEYEKYEGMIAGSFEVLNRAFYDDIESYEVGISYIDVESETNTEPTKIKVDYDRKTGRYDFRMDKLFPGKEYKFRAFMIIDGDVFSSERIDYTKNCTIKLNYNSTETTCTLKSVAQISEDGTFSPISIKVYTKNGCHDIEGYKLTGLLPQAMYSDYATNSVEIQCLIGDTYQNYTVGLLTSTLDLSLNEEVTPTGIKLRPICKSNEVEVQYLELLPSCGNMIRIESDSSNDLWLGGLVPENEYNVKLKAVFKSSKGETVQYEYKRLINKQPTATIPIKTTQLILKTPDTKPVSSSSTMVKAETNVDEREMNIGFQWKKYDAPTTLKASEGYGIVYDGLIEGLINNLQPTSYYNVRTFYKDSSDNYYFSEWQTFDPSDFSYLEPTVHTFPAENIIDGSANLKGSVLAGTDNIVEQGFEYWMEGAAPVKTMATGIVGPATVLSTGQRMEAVVEGLKPDSEYHFRAYAKTLTGTTYGDERTFVTPAVSGIIPIVSESLQEVFIEGYYSLSGQRHKTPQKGFNIIRYSDGSIRKIIVQ